MLGLTQYPSRGTKYMCPPLVDSVTVHQPANGSKDRNQGTHDALPTLPYTGTSRKSSQHEPLLLPQSAEIRQSPTTTRRTST